MNFSDNFMCYDRIHCNDILGSLCFFDKIGPEGRVDQLVIGQHILGELLGNQRLYPFDLDGNLEVDWFDDFWWWNIVDEKLSDTLGGSFGVLIVWTEKGPGRKCISFYQTGVIQRYGNEM